MKQISLTKGHVALVDDVDYPWLSNMRWCSSSDGYATNYYTDEHGRRHRRGMHRIIMAHMLSGPIPRNLTVDHIDRNRLNNTRSNLRLATRTQNQANKGYCAHFCANMHSTLIPWSSHAWIVWPAPRCICARSLMPCSARGYIFRSSISTLTPVMPLDGYCSICWGPLPSLKWKSGRSARWMAFIRPKRAGCNSVPNLNSPRNKLLNCASVVKMVNSFGISCETTVSPRPPSIATLIRRHNPAFDLILLTKLHFTAASLPLPRDIRCFDLTLRLQHFQFSAIIVTVDKFNHWLVVRDRSATGRRLIEQSVQKWTNEIVAITIQERTFKSIGEQMVFKIIC